MSEKQAADLGEHYTSVIVATSGRTYKGDKMVQRAYVADMRGDDD